MEWMCNSSNTLGYKCNFIRANITDTPRFSVNTDFPPGLKNIWLYISIPSNRSKYYTRLCWTYLRISHKGLEWFNLEIFLGLSYFFSSWLWGSFYYKFHVPLCLSQKIYAPTHCKHLICYHINTNCYFCDGERK